MTLIALFALWHTQYGNELPWIDDECAKKTAVMWALWQQEKGNYPSKKKNTKKKKA